jgi:spore coat protein U-like protein
MMRRLTRAVSLLVALLAFLAPKAGAQCTLSFSSLTFPTYTGTADPGTATGTHTGCAGENGTTTLGPGTGVGGSETIRYMTGPGGAVLAYGLFTNAAMTNYFGDTTGNEDTWSGNQPIYVYGQITAGQYPTPGTYTDTVQSPYPANGKNNPLSVSVTVLKACTVTATNLGFGNYTGTVINSTSTISVSCTSSTAYNVGLNQGLATGATVTTREMNITQPGTAGKGLNYSLHSASATGPNWGNTTGSLVSGTGNGAAQPLTVYGQLPAAQHVAPGTYTDTITVNVSY